MNKDTQRALDERLDQAFRQADAHREKAKVLDTTASKHKQTRSEVPCAAIRGCRAPGACESINNPERARMQNGMGALTSARNRKIFRGFEFGVLLTEGGAGR